ncbi:MAG TPA: hypothetical protein VGD39_17900 [Nocardioides sp.]
MGIHAEAVDERDSSWEDHSPRFRVYVHSHPGPSSATSTYDLTGADVLQAVDWAQSHVPAGGTYAVALVQDRPGPAGPERGLVWLVGIDGNTDPANESERDALGRMAERATTPVVIPPADRAGGSNATRTCP